MRANLLPDVTTTAGESYVTLTKPEVEFSSNCGISAETVKIEDEGEMEVSYPFSTLISDMNTGNSAESAIHMGSCWFQFDVTEKADAIRPLVRDGSGNPVIFGGTWWNFHHRCNC
jgi:hypothetical protein